MSALFDCGGIAGAILAGLLSDYIGMNAITCAVMLLLAVPVVSIFKLFNIYYMGSRVVRAG